MKTSEQINELAAALAKAQGAIKPAPKDTENTFFHSKYATLANVMDACRAPLSNNGLAVVQGVSASENGIVVTTRLMHSSGQWIEDTLPLRPTKNDPQGCGSAITYARRYGLAALIGVVADDDDDGNAASAPAAKAEAKPKPATKSAEKPPIEMTPEQKAFNEWVAEHIVRGRLTKERVKTALTAVDGDYVRAKAELLTLESMKG